MTKNKYICDCDIIHHDLVNEALAMLPTHAELRNLSTTYKILGDETRYKICYILNQYEMCVCDLANVLSMSKSSISHQLRILRENHIVRARQSGKEVYYRLDDEHIEQILQLGVIHAKHLQKEDYEEK